MEADEGNPKYHDKNAGPHGVTRPNLEFAVLRTSGIRFDEKHPGKKKAPNCFGACVKINPGLLPAAEEHQRAHAQASQHERRRLGNHHQNLTH
jgi:hypothetical protein